MKISFDATSRQALVVDMLIYCPGRERSWKLRAAIDTGASTSLIPSEAALSLGYRPDGSETQRIVTGEGILYLPRIVLGRVDVGPASVRDVEAVCHDLPEEAPVDALLGLSFLTRFRLSFDFDAWEMELTPRA